MAHTLTIMLGSSPLFTGIGWSQRGQTGTVTFCRERFAEHQHSWGHLALQTEHNRADTTDVDVVETHAHDGYKSVSSKVEHFT